MLRRSGIAVVGLSAALLVVSGAGVARHDAQPSAPPLGFTLTLAPAAERQIAGLGLETPVEGRAFVLISRDSAPEPRLAADVDGPALYGRDVHGLRGSGSVAIAAGDSGVVGYPLRLHDIPAGDYWVQGFLGVYTTFRRADGHVLHMHADAGDGQHLWISPGNAYSAPRRVHLDPAAGGTVALTLDHVIPPLQPVPPGGVLQQGNPADRPQVRFVKIRSALLSAFWGRDMYIGANVLLPRGYDSTATTRYPTIYEAGHFPGERAPFGFAPGATRGRGAGFADWWMGDEAPRVVAVAIRDANPYYDTSYWVDSPNVGPYGQAITHELIPYLEKTFHLIPESWARTVAGGSTGGWEALAVQVFNPDEFGGTWGWCPDPVDFHYHQIVDLYDDGNAYVRPYGSWLDVERPGARRPDGNVVYTVRDENDFERAVGPDDRSGGQWAIWEAAFGPVGANGYPARVWDPVTGQVHHDVATWWHDHTDLNAYLGRNWATVGAKLRGKLHVAVGEDDTYYLDDAVHLLEDSLKTRTSPPAEASFEYGAGKPHCWTGASPAHPGQALSSAEAVQIMADYMARNAPPGTDVRAWHH